MPVLAATIFFMAAISGGAQEKPGNFQGWPISWRSTYQRFEQYLEQRQKFWPESGLTLDTNGQIQHSLPRFQEREEWLGLRFFRNGCEFLSAGLQSNKNLLGERQEDFVPGLYCASLYSVGSLGYQSHDPLVWFQVVDHPTKDKDWSMREIRITNPPVSKETAWPHPLIIHFMDYYVFRNHHRDDLYKKNEEVSPAVLLEVGQDGMIYRNKIEDPLEKLLRWRLYFNGQLIHNDSAAQTLRLAVDRGVGTYQALVGVEGPSGFMPVSNLSEFPLFPDGTNGFEIIPKDSNNDGTPDFIEKLQHSTKNSPENIAEITTISSDQEQIFLWKAWQWDLKTPQRFLLHGIDKTNLSH